MPTTPPPGRQTSDPDIDLAWTDEDEAPPRTPPPPEPSHQRASDRVTVAPPMPPEEYAATIMASAPLGDTRRDGRRKPARKHTPLRSSKSQSPGIRTPVMRAAVPSASAPSVKPALSLDLTTESVMPRAFLDPPSTKAGTVVDLSLGSREGGALDLISSRVSRTSPAPGDPLHAVRDHFDVGDFSGALVLVDAFLETDPTNVEAITYATECREKLSSMYLSRLGGPRVVPRAAVPSDQIRWLSLDHRAGFLLSLCDGKFNIDEILDASGMSRLETLRVLFELLQESVIQVA